MSCYNWERGTVIIPTKEWAKFRTTLIKAWNDREEQRLEKAKKLHGQITLKLKGKRGSKRQEALREFHDQYLNYHASDFATIEMVVDCKWEGGKRSYELKGLPKKKDAKILPTSKDADIYLEDASIHLRNKTRTVAWDVGENNRAVERAHEHPIAKKLFTLLSQITWTRGTGGKIVGNDEYNRESDYDGGGSNYVTKDYHMLTAKEKKAKAEAKRHSSYPSAFGGASRYYR